ncbi:pyocin knob domain-containing protein [Paenibacillus taichungensis]|uniref:pyocin knob domain-containing protein n=1 Tax=Paenibacillus taichungensis TaxID=484184 RepID=UPI0039A50997
MNEPKTPNLGLNKIDRSSPSTTYFDLDKYLDQNWEKVDDFAEQLEGKSGETAEQVKSIQDRLNTEKRRSVKLEPGLQIINAERASAIKLEGIKGRTLVNLLGRDGNFGDVTRWNVGLGTRTVANNVIMVTGNGTGVNPQLTNYNHISALNPKVGDKLFLRVRATHIVGTAKQLQLYLYSNTLNRFTAMNIDNPVSGSTYDMYGVITVNQAIVDGWDTTFGFKLTAEYATYEASNGSQVQFSNAAIYKVSDEDKSLTSSQMALKYPYVDSLQPVRNPYAIRYGENLLPSLMNSSFVLSSNYVNGPYEWSNLLGADATGYTIVKFNVMPNTNYTFSAETFLNLSTSVYPLDLQTPAPLRPWTNDSTFTFNSGQNSEINFLWRASSGGNPASLKNPMIALGTTTKPFKPREDAMLALQTDLYADPITGANADEVFEKEGQYYKLTKWKKISFDSTYTYSFFNSYAGGKCVRLMDGITDRNKKYLPMATKFNGVRLSDGSPSLNVDQYSRGDWDTGANGVFLGIGVSSADSGWGDSYTPTPDEIKAYFMGWKMSVNGSPRATAYDGTGTKVWIRITRMLDSIALANGVDYTTALPTTLAGTDSLGNLYTPYQLAYQLATPTVESITSEGQLTFTEGSNQVEVGTGIVLREPAKPIKFDNYDINTGKTMGNATLYAVDKWIALYENGHLKPTGWGVFEGQDNGKAIAIYGHQYNPSAAYSVTYLMKDVSPVTSFLGSISVNEKALLTDLTKSVHQNTASLSMLEISAADGGVLKNYVDNKPWQKYKITQDNGSIIQLPHNSNLNNIKNGGQYDCFNAVNVPGGVVNAWFYVEVLVHSNAPTHVIQRASRLDTHNTPTLYMRTCMDNIWSEWSPDVFQSGVDAKNGIVDAINAMGSSASMNDTWLTLASKIHLIKNGKRFATGQFVIGSNGAGSATGLGFKPRNITFANATNTPSNIYFGVYSEDSPRNNYSLGGTRFLNRVVGLDNGLSTDDKIVPTVNGFNVSGTGITDQRTYNYFATE